MKKLILQLLRDESGLTTVEYAVAGSMITAALVGAFVTLGNAVASGIDTIRTAGW